MKPWEYLISTLLAVFVLTCSIMVVLSAQNVRRLERILNAQQEEINKGQISNQIGIALLQEMAAASANNPKMLALLERNGFKVNFKRPESQVPTPGSTTP